MARRGKKKKKQKRVSTLLDIVIPVWDGFNFLWNCLEALPAAVGDIPTRVIIYDNGSDKQKADEFYASVQGIEVIRAKQNTGFADACNRGVQKGHSPLVLLLNSDATMRPGSIEKMVRRMDFPEVGVCGARLLFSDDSPNGTPGHIQHAGLMMTVRAEVVHCFIDWSDDNSRTRMNDEFFAVTGACLMTRRNLWNQIRGLDLSYGMGTYEEVDYCMAISGLGKKIVVEHEAVGTHYVGAALTEHQVGFPLAVNRAKFMSKWAEQIIWDEWSKV